MPGRAARDAVCAKFRLSAGPKPIELQFFVDTDAGVIGPQMRILLQLIADGAEAKLATWNRAPEKTSAIASTSAE
jgi:hypothetical protein